MNIWTSPALIVLPSIIEKFDMFDSAKTENIGRKRRSSKVQSEGVSLDPPLPLLLRIPSVVPRRTELLG